MSNFVVKSDGAMFSCLHAIDLGGLWLKAHWNFRSVGLPLRDGWLISLTYEEADIATGKMEPQTTREWFIPLDPTVNDVLRTCRKCLLGSMEHRVDEHFLFNGKRVYDPHREVV